MHGLAQRLVALPAPLLLAACTAEGAGSVPEPRPPEEGVAVPGDVVRVLHLDMEDVAAPPGTVVGDVDNAVQRDMAVSVSTAAGGRPVVVEGPQGAGQALRLPAYSASGAVPAATVVVRARGRWDALTPARKVFRVGARFTLDKRSAGTDRDDGDNLVQRGLSDDAAQYKLQIDDGIPSCLVRGERGEVLAKATRAVRRDTWYEVTCERSGDRLRLRLERVDGGGRPIRASARGATGRVLPDREVPLSVGGKVSPEGEITISSTDQFNGAVDDVYVEYQR